MASPLFERLPELVVLAEGDGRLRELNAAARAFVGSRGREGMALGHLLDVLAPTAPSARRAALDAALAEGQSWGGVLDLLDPSGALLPHLCTLTGDVHGIALICRDATDQRAREAAEREITNRDEFVARLGHELRTPLNAMLGFAQLLELDDPSPAQQESISRILVGGRHMQSLLDDVLDLARLRTGGVDLDVGPVRVLDVVRGVVDLVEPLADRRAIRRYVTPEADLVALADRRRLWQVLLNLIGNAVKYGREGGTVRVGVEPVGPADAPPAPPSGRPGEQRRGGPVELVRIEVEDDGPGIDPEQLHRLFRPFERLGQERTAVEGSGLGLAMSQALTSAMGGRLSAASRLGAGSTFRVELPALDRRELGDDIPVQPRTTATPVVHVSAETGSQAMVSAALRRRFDVEVHNVGRAAEALETVRRTQPALVLLDADLPDATPTELLHRLGGDPLSTLVPKIVLTFDPDPGMRLRLRAAGATEVLALPLDVKSMLEVVGRRLARPGEDGR